MAQMAGTSKAVQMAGGASGTEVLERNETFNHNSLTGCPPMLPMQGHISLPGLDEEGNPMLLDFEVSSLKVTLLPLK